MFVAKFILENKYFLQLKNLFLASIFICLFAGIFSSCKDDNFTSNSSYRISFSTDTLSFDTVFTTLVTPMRRIMVYNRTSENIRIENIKLYSKFNCFQVNVSGQSGTEFHNIELRSKDSLYIFVQVNVRELGQNAPLHILDSLEFKYNNNVEKVMLQTYGQDVHHFKNRTITEDTRWTNDKPYLIRDTLKVENGAKLTIDAGVRLFFHNNATMVVKGTLSVEGDEHNPVIFRGNRTDNLFNGLPYDKISGQWGGILFTKESTGNQINGAMIRNGIFGIQVDSAEIQSGVYRLILSNSQIHNTKQAALKATSANIYAYNTVISNSAYTCVLLEGGDYLFNHCTIANYPTIARVFSALILANHIQFNENQKIKLNATFNNCIIYGTFQQEIRMENHNGTGDVSKDDFNYKFNSCLIRYQPNQYAGNSGFNIQSDAFQNVIWNESPDFLSVDNNEYDFRIGSSSAAIENGDIEIIIQYPECRTDKNGVVRPLDKNPDMGAYEYVEEP